MGKRKSARKPVVRQKVRLEKQFTCLFCNHEKSIECKLNREHNIGYLTCRSCGIHWETTIHYLSEPVDVFSEWLDACEAENKRRQREAELGGPRARVPRRDAREEDEDADEEEEEVPRAGVRYDTDEDDDVLLPEAPISSRAQTSHSQGAAAKKLALEESDEEALLTEEEESAVETESDADQEATSDHETAATSSSKKRRLVRARPDSDNEDGSDNTAKDVATKAAEPALKKKKPLSAIIFEDSDNSEEV